MAYLARLLRDRRGGTAIEYALVGVLIAVAAIVAMQGLGNQVNTTIGGVNDKVRDATAR